MNSIPPTYEVIKGLRYKTIHLVIDSWLKYTVFTPTWWALVLFLIVPWMVWWKLVDKKSLKEIGMYGLVILLFTALFDDIGTGLMWWGYPHKLVPMVRILMSPDFSLVPCLMMLVFQYFKTWKSFLISNFLLSLLMAYIGERLFIKLNVYELLTWKLFYSVLFYNLIGVLARFIVLKINDLVGR